MQPRGPLGFRQISPVLTGLPLLLFAMATLFDLGVMISGLEFLASISNGLLAAALIVGVLLGTALLVLFTSGPMGPAARRALGIVTAASTGMVVAFGLVWCVRAEAGGGVGGGVFLLEVLALSLGWAGSWYGRVAAAGPGLYEAPRQHATEMLSRRATGGLRRRLDLGGVPRQRSLAQIRQRLSLYRFTRD